MMEQTKSSTNDTSINILQIKLQSLRKNLDAIVLYRDNIKLYEQCILADRILKTLKYQIIKNPSFASEYTKTLNVYEEQANLIFKEIVPFNPSLAYVDIKNWRALNDSFEEKDILARRKNTFVFVPKTNESGMWGIIAKILHKTVLQIQMDTSADAEKISQFAAVYQKAKETLEKINSDMLLKYNITIIPKKPLKIK